MADTIYAVASGAAPAAIAIIRISGPDAFAAVRALTGSLPPPRRASLRTLRDDTEMLDRALVLVFPAPNTATGEDLAELHCHGGRAVVRAVEAALARQPGLRAAQPGEFTRRALANGRIDLAQAEGLADLIAAETQDARRVALAAADGAISRVVARWVDRLFALSAQVEAQIDFADEDDVVADEATVAALTVAVGALADELATAASTPCTERLRDGVRVVFAGPPNSGKSSLINAMAERHVAIASDVPGTTRDRIDAPVVRFGRAYVLTDVAGLRDDPEDAIEKIGIAHAHAAMAEADLVIWLGDDDPPAPTMLAVNPRADLPGRALRPGRLSLSTVTGQGVADLWEMVAERTAGQLPRADQVAFNMRQAERLAAAAAALKSPETDPLLLAEQLRAARGQLAHVTGAENIDLMLDALFTRFCIGK